MREKVLFSVHQRAGIAAGIVLALSTIRHRENKAVGPSDSLTVLSDNIEVLQPSLRAHFKQWLSLLIGVKEVAIALQPAYGNSSGLSFKNNHTILAGPALHTNHLRSIESSGRFRVRPEACRTFSSYLPSERFTS